MLESNQRQSACKTGALPTELIAYIHLVGRAGVEPAQSQTGDLQSLGLATCSASPQKKMGLSQLLNYTYSLTFFEIKVKALFNLFLDGSGGGSRTHYSRVMSPAQLPNCPRNWNIYSQSVRISWPRQELQEVSIVIHF